MVRRLFKGGVYWSAAFIVNVVTSTVNLLYMVVVPAKSSSFTTKIRRAVLERELSSRAMKYSHFVLNIMDARNGWVLYAISMKKRAALFFKGGFYIFTSSCDVYARDAGFDLLPLVQLTFPPILATYSRAKQCTSHRHHSFFWWWQISLRRWKVFKVFLY